MTTYTLTQLVDHMNATKACKTRAGALRRVLSARVEGLPYSIVQRSDGKWQPVAHLSDDNMWLACALVNRYVTVVRLSDFPDFECD
jgi:hypothetical protein